ncbi:MAG TPA: hypothetical protein PKX90_12725, partial [bacterium]|nr:hypothetical protein [bacterium]
ELISYLINPLYENQQYSNWTKEVVLNDSNIIYYLIEALNTDNSRILWEIKIQLKKIGKPVSNLLNDFISDTISAGNLTAIEIAGDIGDSIFINKLNSLLSSKYPAVRNISAISAGKIFNNETVKKLCDLLNDENDMVRKSALVSIGKIKTDDTTIIEKIFFNFNDTYYFQKFSAVEALQKFDTTIILPQIFNKLSNSSNTNELSLLLKTLLVYTIDDNEQINILKKIYEETNEKIIKELILKILSKSISIDDYLEQFKMQYKCEPIKI